VDSYIKSPGSEFQEDPRITKMGRFLLKSGLDELPQLFNILKGEMSIVSPKHPLESEKIKSHNRKFS
jgi:lipopolysaccharide/colanic/teichoic acid biosynthesis glycosyltransferase